MTPYINDPDFALYVGDVRDVLAGLPDESVHCVVTSPPYWGLRDYGTGLWDGGDPDCDHTFKPGGTASSTLDQYDNGLNAETIAKKVEGYGHATYRDVCGKCGARRVDRQLGLEPTPDEYVENMVAVFREVRRVLRRDGTCWLNLGDSYGSGTTADRNPTSTEGPAVPASWSTRSQAPRNGLKPKDLVGVPWRVAFALQADGWYLRADVIWSKPNPMPESVSDRPTKAHEYLFLLTRSQRYFYDADAIREQTDDLATKPRAFRNGDAKVTLRQDEGRMYEPRAHRNRRSVWEIATEPYPDAHFATFPQALVEPCVKAGCPEGGTVLDPFMGSGTTALVARRLGRRSVGVELNETYAQLAARRLAQLSLLA